MAEVQVKLRSVLNNILNENFKITDRQKRIILKNVQDEALITETLTPNTHLYLNWIEETLLLWELEGPTKEPLIFFIDIIIELSKNQIIFVHLHQGNTIKRIIKIFDKTEDCDITQTYIKFLDALTQTKFGKNWLCQTLDTWKNVFKVINSQEYTDSLTVFLKDMFLSVDHSELFAIDLFNEVLNPLITVSSRISGNLNEVNEVLEEELSLQLTPTINLLTSIITSITETITIDSQWLNHCNNFPNFKKPLIILLEIIENQEFTLAISKLLISLYFLELKQYSKKIPEFIDKFTKDIIKILDVNICREFLDNITVLAFQLRFFWFHICRILDVQKFKLQSDFGVSLALFETSPFSGICITLLGDKLMSTIEDDDIREDFVVQWVKKIDRSMYFYMYKLRDIIINNRDCFISEAHKTLNYFNDSIYLYDDKGKVMMFYIWQFFLGDMIVDILKNKTVSSKHYDSELVTYLLDTLLFIGKKCDISWKDVVSPILTMGIITDLLQLEDLPFNIVVATLKILNLVIVKNMAPDLSVSMDCSTVNSIGPLLESKLKSENEEVRCTASMVLVTMSESAQVNYPCFRQILLENRLPQQLFDRIFTNEATKLRINALKCLRNLVKIACVWEEISSPKFLEKIIESLKTQTQNQVRSETVNLVATIYEDDYFMYHQVKELYEIVTRLGVHDFDVDVRINTLKFWKIVIKKLLVEEGMIDGAFPNVTFSREARKIVILDEEEIKKRLRRFMGELNRNGCLTVLNSCYRSTEKSEKDFVDEMINNLLEILEKYQIDENNVMSTTIRLEKLILGNLDLPVVSPEEFLKNVARLQTNDDEDSLKIFVRVLEEILKQNKI